jgi:hypothetical protein
MLFVIEGFDRRCKVMMECICGEKYWSAPIENIEQLGQILDPEIDLPLRHQHDSCPLNIITTDPVSDKDLLYDIIVRIIDNHI